MRVCTKLQDESVQDSCTTSVYSR